MNLADSERMAGVLEAAGYRCADDAGDAHVLVYNTCSIRDKAEQKVYSALGKQVWLQSRWAALSVLPSAPPPRVGPPCVMSIRIGRGRSAATATDSVPSCGRWLGAIETWGPPGQLLC